MHEARSIRYSTRTTRPRAAKIACHTMGTASVKMYENRFLISLLRSSSTFALQAGSVTVLKKYIQFINARAHKYKYREDFIY